jgi:hypothetical protein
MVSPTLWTKYPLVKLSDAYRRHAYSQLIASMQDYRPRFQITQPNTNEADRLKVKLKLFVAHQVQKAITHDEYN